MESSQFEETQHLKDTLLAKVMIGIALGAVLFILILSFSGNPEGSKVAIPIFIIIAFTIALLRHSYLSTKINDTGITYQFTPFHLKSHTISWDEIENCHVRNYKPILEYGGWGIRYSFRKGRAYNVAGNMGLQLELKNGKKLLLGTQVPEKLALLLKSRK